MNYSGLWTTDSTSTWSLFLSHQNSDFQALSFKPAQLDCWPWAGHQKMQYRSLQFEHLYILCPEINCDWFKSCNFQIWWQWKL